jgi:phage FluMu gp28-like protein
MYEIEIPDRLRSAWLRRALREEPDALAYVVRFADGRRLEALSVRGTFLFADRVAIDADSIDDALDRRPD